MNKNNLLAFSLFFIIILLAGCTQEVPESTSKSINSTSEPTQTSAITVSRVIDGDTIELSTGERVRLIGIDCPEKGQPYSEEATDKLEALVLGEEIRLEKDISETGRYGRLLRYVYVDDVFVNLVMVESGLAEAYEYEPDTKYSSLFRNAENTAKESGRGMWEIYNAGNCIAVTTFHYDATGNDHYNLNDEYVTFKNYCADAVNMTSWIVKDKAKHIYTTPSFSLCAGCFVTLYTGHGSDTSNKLYWAQDSAVWNNDGDTLYLRDGEGKLVLSYGY